MAPRVLATLPVELKVMIISHLHRPKDLSSLCLVDKHISQLAFPQLYRNLDISSTSSGHSQWIANLSGLSQSRGLQYTRTIKIGHSKFNDSGNDGHCTVLEALVKNLPVDALTRFEFGSYARPAIKGGYDLLWRSQKNLQNLQVDSNPSNPNATISPLTEDVQFLRNLSELKVDFGKKALLRARLWLREVMDGHKFRKIHFTSLTYGRELDMIKMKIPSLQACLIDGNSEILTHLTLHKVELIYDDILSLDEFPCLVYLESEDTFDMNTALEAFHKLHLTHFLLKDNSSFVGRLLALTTFMTRFQTLESIVMDMTEPFSSSGDGEGFAQAIVHHACMRLETTLLHLQRE